MAPSNLLQPWTQGKGRYPWPVADFNGDGALDIAVALAEADGVTVMYGRGDGTFPVLRKFRTDGFSSSPWSIVAVDLNRDHAQDLAVTNQFKGTVSILMNSGGTFVSFYQLRESSTRRRVHNFHRHHRSQRSDHDPHRQSDLQRWSHDLGHRLPRSHRTGQLNHFKPDRRHPHHPNQVLRRRQLQSQLGQARGSGSCSKLRIVS